MPYLDDPFKYVRPVAPIEVAFLRELDARKFANGRPINDGTSSIQVAKGAIRHRNGLVVTVQKPAEQIAWIVE